MQELKKLTGKEIRIVERGNTAILYALEIAKKLNKSKVAIQDQGAWIVYKQYPKKIGLNLTILRTDYGLIDTKNLSDSIDSDSALLITSMAGYIAVQDMDTMYNICKEKGCLLINDITGTIGMHEGTVGDILVCSFGKTKPLNIGKGGMIAAKKDILDLIQIKEIDIKEQLKERLSTLKKRQEFLKATNEKIKDNLRHLGIIHKNKQGINVVIKYKDEQEKEQIITYCQKNNFKYRMCKKVKDSTKNLFSFIKVNEDAVSIEVQELESFL